MKLPHIKQVAIRTARCHKGKVVLTARRLLNQIGLRKKKVFAIGFNKSGTTSLHALFRSLGLLSYHGVKWRDCDDLKLLKSFDCFSDDIPKDLAKLDNLFPGSKFILQVRNLDSWVYSRLAHIEREKEENSFIGGPEWDITEFAIKAWIMKRNTHHLFVLSYFSQRPDDFLVVNFIRDESAATKVSNFLGYEGKYERPKRNINPRNERPLKHSELLRNVITELGIPETELSYDILCKSLISSETQIRFPQDTSTLESADCESSYP